MALKGPERLAWATSNEAKRMSARSGRSGEEFVRTTMAKQTKIKVVSYVHVGDELVEWSQLTPEQKEKAATILKVNYLNALFAGKAEFRAEE